MQCGFGCGRFGSKKICGRFGCGPFGVWPFWPGSPSVTVPEQLLPGSSLSPSKHICDSLHKKCPTFQETTHSAGIFPHPPWWSRYKFEKPKLQLLVYITLQPPDYMALQPRLFPCLYAPFVRLYYKFVHYSDVIMSAVVPQITSLTIVYSTVYSGADQRKHQNSASLVSVQGIHRLPMNSQHKGPIICSHLMTSSYLDNKNSDKFTIFASHMIKKWHLTSPQATGLDA